MTAPIDKSFAGHKIVANPSGMLVAERLAKELGADTVSVYCGFHPDKTKDVRVPESLSGQDVIIVGHTRSEIDAVEVGLLQSALRGIGVKSIGTVIPHYPYARQDRGTKGKPNGVELMAKVIGNTDWLIVVDPHKPSIFDFFGVTTRTASCGREIGDYLYGKQIDLILAPDEGALPRAKELGEFLGVPFDNYEKERLNGSEVSVKPKKLNLPGVGARVAIVDDIVSTGGTMIAASIEAKRNGASYLIAVCTHGLFLGDSLERLKAVYDEVVCADTVRSVDEVAKISCVPSIVRALKAMP